MNWLLLRNSLLVSGLTTLVACGLGVAAALWLACLGPRWRNTVLAVSIMALAVPPFLATNCWLALLGPNGLWRRWLPFDVVSVAGTVWILSLLLWPIPMLAVWSAWQRLEPSHLESDMAVTGWPLIRVLLLPLAWLALAQAAVLTFVLALNNFDVPSILQVKVFPAEMWVVFNTTFNTLGALRLSWPLIAGPLLLLLWFSRRPLPWPRLEGRVSAKLLRQQLGRAWVWGCGLLTVGVCFFAVGAPLYQLASAKRTWRELPGAFAASVDDVWRSAWFAAVSAALIVAIGLAVAEWNMDLRGGSRAPRLWTRVVGWVLWLAFLTPGVLLGIGLIVLLNRSWLFLFYESVGIVVLAFTLRYLAFGWHAAAHALGGTDPDLTDAATLSGANRWQMLRQVHWPQVSTQVAAVWYIVYLLCLWDVGSMILVVPPGGETLALRVFNMLHYGHNAQVNALCVLLLGLAVAPLLVWMGGRFFRDGMKALGSRAGQQRARRGRSGLRPAHQHCSLGIGHLPLFIGNAKCSMPNVQCSMGREEQSPVPLASSSLQARARGSEVPLAGKLRVVFLSACLLALLGGCSPKLPSGEVPLNGKIFRAVQVIGSRGVGVGQFNKPKSVAVDRQDNLYVVDMTGRVQKFSSNGVYLMSWQMPELTRGRPKGMCRDYNGNIVVVEPHYQRINHFTTNGVLVAQWGQQGTNPGEFYMPRAAAVNSHNEMYVSEYGLVERVQRFSLGSGPIAITAQVTGAWTPSSGTASFSRRGRGRPRSYRMRQAAWPEQLPVANPAPHVRLASVGPAKAATPYTLAPFKPRLLNVFGRPGMGPGEFNRVEGLCVDSHDNVYVADSCNHRIQVFTREGKFLRMYGKPGKGLGELSYPYDIRVDKTGLQFVCEFGNSRIQVFDAHDRPIEIIGGPGAEPGQFNDPWSLALDSEGDLYVADSLNHRVQKLIRRK